MRTLIVGVAALVAGCSSDKAAPAPPPPAPAKPAKSPTVLKSTVPKVAPDPAVAPTPTPTPTPAPAARTAAAHLGLTGALTATLEAKNGTCTCDGDHAMFSVRDDGRGQVPFDLTILVTSAAEWTNPAITINVRAPKRGTYGRNAGRHRAADKLSIARDCSTVTLDDVLLKGLGTKGEITLKGAITCSK